MAIWRVGSDPDPVLSGFETRTVMETETLRVLEITGAPSSPGATTP